MYVDTGIMLKAFVPEPESDEVQKILGRVADVACSELLLVEFQSALSRKLREKRIDEYALLECQAALKRTIGAGGISIVKLDSSAVETSVKLLADMPGAIPLRTLDAIHLAVCLDHQLFPLFASDAIMLKAAAHLKIPVVTLDRQPIATAG